MIALGNSHPNSQSSYIRHLKEKHGEDSQFQCTICFKKLTRSEYLDAHLRAHNEDAKVTEQLPSLPTSPSQQPIMPSNFNVSMDHTYASMDAPTNTDEIREKPDMTFIVDTNIIMRMLPFIAAILDNCDTNNKWWTIMIPYTVLEELETLSYRYSKFQKGHGDLPLVQQAKQFNKTTFETEHPQFIGNDNNYLAARKNKQKKFFFGNQLFYILFLVAQKYDEHEDKIKPGLKYAMVKDNNILNCAYHRQRLGEQCMIVTNDGGFTMRSFSFPFKFIGTDGWKEYYETEMEKRRSGKQ